MKYLIFIFILLSVIIANPCNAEIMVTSSLEWLADHCIDSGFYKVKSLSPKEGLIDGYNCEFELVKVYRGKPPKFTLEGYSRTLHSEPQRHPIVKKGDEFLLFWQHYSTGEKRIVCMINLSNPAMSGPNFIAVTSEMKLLKSKEEILNIFESRLKEKPKADPVEINDYSKDNRTEISDGEIFDAIWSGSSCYIRIPSDLKNN